MWRAVFWAALLLGMADPALAKDAERGRQVFKETCLACHSLEPDKHKVGPSLSGLWGRKAGSLQDYSYSPALESADVEWAEDTLDAWLTDPEGFIPGNFMGFTGIADDDRRADLIAFLMAASGTADGE